MAPSSACSSLLPNELRQDITGAPLPKAHDVGSWIQFGDAQTGQLDKANLAKRTAIGVIERCEARDSQAVKSSKPKFFGIF